MSKLTLDLESVDFSAIVLETVALHRRHAAMAGSVLEVDAPRIMGHWDEVLLGRTVSNLLENTTKSGWATPFGFCQFAGPWGHPFAGSWGQGNGLNNRVGGCLEMASASTG